MNDATKTCRIEGCTRPCMRSGYHYFRSICRMHAHRYYRTGTYELLDRTGSRTVNLPGPCDVSGCTRQRTMSGYRASVKRTCSMHQERKRTTGSYGQPEPMRAANGTGYTLNTGYRMVTVKFPIRELEHRVIWEAANGPIPDKHHIHHINGVKDDNRIENLQCLSAAEHARLHHEKGEDHQWMHLKQ
jgi:hypothetical protein